MSDKLEAAKKFIIDWMAEKDHDYYIMDENKNVIRPKNRKEGLDWFSESKRMIKRQTIDGYFISTIFLVFDSNFGLGGEPLLFETMIFDKQIPKGQYDCGRELHHYQERYPTHKDALAGHREAVKLVKRYRHKIIFI